MLTTQLVCKIVGSASAWLLLSSTAGLATATTFTLESTVLTFNNKYFPDYPAPNDFAPGSLFKLTYTVNNNSLERDLCNDCFSIDNFSVTFGGSNFSSHLLSNGDWYGAADLAGNFLLSWTANNIPDATRFNTPGVGELSLSNFWEEELSFSATGEVCYGDEAGWICDGSPVGESWFSGTIKTNHRAVPESSSLNSILAFGLLGTGLLINKFLHPGK